MPLVLNVHYKARLDSHSPRGSGFQLMEGFVVDYMKSATTAHKEGYKEIRERKGGVCFIPPHENCTRLDLELDSPIAYKYAGQQTIWWRLLKLPIY
jgi:hypothetical protein